MDHHQNFSKSAFAGSVPEGLNTKPEGKPKKPKAAGQKGQQQQHHNYKSHQNHQGRTDKQQGFSRQNFSDGMHGMNDSMKNMNLGNDNAYSPMGGGFYGAGVNVNANGASGSGSGPHQPQWDPPQPAQLVPDSSALEGILKCTICYVVRRPPIYCCQGGHNVCSKCRFEATSCPVCRQGMSDVRNLTVEKLAASYKFPCSYAAQGCETKMDFSNEDKHISICNYRPVGCDNYPCKNDRVDFKDYIQHQRKNHRAPVLVKDKAGVFRRETFLRNMDNLLRQGMRPPYIVEFLDQTFLVQTKATGHKMWFWVALFGTPEEARRYRATLTVKKGTGPAEMQASWTGPVHSVRHHADEIYTNGLCMVTTEECLRAMIYPKDQGFAYCMEVVVMKIL